MKTVFNSFHHTPPPTTLPADVFSIQILIVLSITHIQSKLKRWAIEVWRFFAVGTFLKSPHSYSIHAILSGSEIKKNSYVSKNERKATIIFRRKLILGDLKGLHEKWMVRLEVIIIAIIVRFSDSRTYQNWWSYSDSSVWGIWENRPKKKLSKLAENLIHCVIEWVEYSVKVSVHFDKNLLCCIKFSLWLYYFAPKCNRSATHPIH